MDTGLIRELFDSKKEIIVYGAGLRGDIITRTLLALDIKCIAIIDRDVKKQGECLNGIE